MRILHLSADWKWTGPAAPLLALLSAQRRRGEEVCLACPEPPVPTCSSLAARARSAGVPPVLELPRGRGLQLWRDGPTARRLSALLASRRIDVVHAWHTRDHLLALRATGPRRRAGSRVVRSLSSAGRVPALPWSRWLLGPGADGVLCASPGSVSANARLRGGRAIAGAFGAVDLDHFRPAPADPRLREALGLEAEHRVVAIAARVQPHRRFDLLLAAWARVAARDPYARLLVLGRGTQIDALAQLPAERLGVGDRVIFAGYRRDDYADALRCADVFTLLAPGSDGTCRALLEAAACGLPAVVTGRGALPEIVDAGRTGLVVAEDPSALADAFERLLSDASLRSALGLAARRRAEIHFAPEVLADRAGALYAAALGARKE